MTQFMSKQLQSPLIASSCIATESAANVLRLAQNGVRGAILKLCADYQRRGVSGKRQFAVDANGCTHAPSPFGKEILTIDKCLDLMRELHPQTDILLNRASLRQAFRPTTGYPPASGWKQQAQTKYSLTSYTWAALSEQTVSPKSWYIFFPNCETLSEF